MTVDNEVMEADSETINEINKACIGKSSEYAISPKIAIRHLGARNDNNSNYWSHEPSPFSEEEQEVIPEPPLKKRKVKKAGLHNERSLPVMIQLFFFLASQTLFLQWIQPAFLLLDLLVFLHCHCL